MNCHVFSYGLPQPGLKRGGIEQVAHDLAQGLAQRGHRVVVWTHDSAPPGAAYEIRLLPGRRWANSWWGRRLTMGYLGHFLALGLRPERGSVILAHGDSLLLPLLGRPVIRVMHGSAWEEARHATSPLRFLHQAGVYVLELLTTVTQRRVVAVSRNTCRFHPFIRRVIPNGVDLSRFQADPARRAVRPTVLFVGALTGRKRGDLLVHWFREHVRPACPDAELHVVGEAHRGGPGDNGEFYHTGVPADKLADMYRAAWVYASPSSYEGFGLPYVEAMASGTPVLATSNPGSREVTEDGRYGCLASDAEFPGRLVRLLQDAEERQRWSELGLARSRDYRLATMVDAYEALLREAAP